MLLANLRINFSLIVTHPLILLLGGNFKTFPLILVIFDKIVDEENTYLYDAFTFWFKF